MQCAIAHYPRLSGFGIIIPRARHLSPRSTAPIEVRPFRLGRLLTALLPAESEVLGLLALMLLIDARRDARLAGGALIRLVEQNRDLWDEAKLEEGRGLSRICLARNRPGPYQLQAAINAVHGDPRFMKRSQRPMDRTAWCYSTLRKTLAQNPLSPRSASGRRASVVRCRPRNTISTVQPASM
jgi:predicted RNA polymerase sigma factor